MDKNAWKMISNLDAHIFCDFYSIIIGHREFFAFSKTNIYFTREIK